jgi:hypothetical protein
VQEAGGFVAELKVQTDGAPFADAFYVEVQVVGLWLEQKKCRLRVAMRVGGGTCPWGWLAAARDAGAQGCQCPTA